MTNETELMPDVVYLAPTAWDISNEATAAFREERIGSVKYIRADAQLVPEGKKLAVLKDGPEPGYYKTFDPDSMPCATPLIRRFIDDRGDLMVEVSGWFYDMMVSLLDQVTKTPENVSFDPANNADETGNARSMTRVEVCTGVQVFMTQEQMMLWAEWMRPKQNTPPTPLNDAHHGDLNQQDDSPDAVERGEKSHRLNDNQTRALADLDWLIYDLTMYFGVDLSSSESSVKKLRDRFKSIRVALTHAPIDLDALKREISEGPDASSFSPDFKDGWRICIDELHSRGLIRCLSNSTKS